MNNKTIFKKYIYLRFRLASPISIGSGLSNETDKDVVKDSRGVPYIPGTALAGLYRSLFSDYDQNKYFGYIKDSDSKESPVTIYDAKLVDPSRYSLSIRNGVGLDPYKTALSGAKFDYEVVNPEAEFWTAVEYTSETDDDTPIGVIAFAWEKGQIIIGGKSTRGMGRLELIKEESGYFSFNLSKDVEHNDIDKWLDFDIYDLKDIPPDAVADLNDLLARQSGESDKYITIKLVLDQKSPLTIREYTTEVSGKDSTAPDYSQLIYKNGEREVAVVPGTSWAGVFRHNMSRYLKDSKEIGKLFGDVDGDSTTKSKILFSETYFDNGYGVIMSRNAINRFSGGASDKSLFTEKMYCGGTNGCLSISLPKASQDYSSNTLKCLAASICDLEEGFIAVGGETSIGHGLFTLKSVSVGDDVLNIDGTDAGRSGSIYTFILNILMEVR